MHIFRGSFSYISEFKTFLKIIYEALIILSSITKKGEIESASMPPSGFSCLNDKAIKELMSFAKCETVKCLLIMLRLFILQDICYGYVTHLCMPYDKKNVINRERRKRIDHLCLMSIATIRYIQDMKTYSSISTLQRITNHYKKLVNL
jgi:hypothetical protein